MRRRHQKVRILVPTARIKGLKRGGEPERQGENKEKGMYIAKYSL
jgi:hypothetical protein